LEHQIAEIKASFAWRLLQRCDRYGLLSIPRVMLAFGRRLRGKKSAAPTNSVPPIVPIAPASSLPVPSPTQAGPEFVLPCKDISESFAQMLKCRPTSFNRVFQSPAFMSPQERVLMYGLTFALAPERYLEVGTCWGGSAVIVTAALDDMNKGRAFGVDPFPRVAKEVMDGIKHRFTLIKGPSPAALVQAKEQAGGLFEMILVDGDHSYQSTIDDLEGVLTVAAPEAAILIHDAYNDIVDRAIRDFIAAHADRLVDCGMLATSCNVMMNQGVREQWGGLHMLRLKAPSAAAAVIDANTRMAPVTVVLVSRNRSAQLRVVLPALAANTMAPDEVILSDDASDDDTVAVFQTLCKQLGLKGRVLQHAAGETRFRINSMRNAGIKASKTDRVILMDADHVPSPTHIAAHMRMLDRGRQSFSTGPRLECANPDGSGPVNFMWGHEPFSAMSPSAGQPVPSWSLVAGSNLGLHRAFAEEIGLFDVGYDGAYGYDDVDFNCRAAKKGAQFHGDFAAHVIHLPHENVLGNREESRNGKLFETKNGEKFIYPWFVSLVTYPENWAKRYAAFLKQQTRVLVSKSPGQSPPPEPGEASIAATYWAATNVGGRFLLKLAFKKFIARLRRLGGRS
jgi:glycosyltransferase involved in cell wall biosynthesis/predicted O-methyltransferase YrrM